MISTTAANAAERVFSDTVHRHKRKPQRSSVAPTYWLLLYSLLLWYTAYLRLNITETRRRDGRGRPPGAPPARPPDGRTNRWSRCRRRPPRHVLLRSPASPPWCSKGLSGCRRRSCPSRGQASASPGGRGTWLCNPGGARPRRAERAREARECARVSPGLLSVLPHLPPRMPGYAPASARFQRHSRRSRSFGSAPARSKSSATSSCPLRIAIIRAPVTSAPAVMRTLAASLFSALLPTTSWSAV